MKFYRIEDKKGVGMYSSTETQGEISNGRLMFMHRRHMDRTILPNVFNDTEIKKTFIRNPKIKYIFAFNSFERLKKIIKEEELVVLKELGLDIFEIECEDYVQTPYQAILDSSKIISKKIIN